MITKIGVVYGEVSGGLRYIVVPDRDEQLDSIHAKRLMPGEAMLSLDLAKVQVGKNGLSDSVIRAELEKHTGKPIPDPRCVVVDNGVVVDVMLADPLIDQMADGKSLVLSAVAEAGWQVDADGALVDSATLDVVAVAPAGAIA